MANMADNMAGTRIVGGASVPSAHMRVNATWPLAVLDLVGPRLSLRLRWPGRLLGAERLEATAADVQRAYPVRRFMVSGIGLTDRRGRDFYFWTSRSHEVLHLLRGAGFSVSDVVEKPSKLWRGIP